jgi:hypothetical protein
MNNAQGQKPKGRYLANVSFALAIVILIYTVLMPMIVGLSEMEVGIIISLAGIISGIAALVRIKRAKGQLGACVTAIFGIVICAASGFALLNAFQNDRERVYRMVCGCWLRELGTAMQVYTGEFDGKYPTAEKWCDLLIQSGYIDEKQFVCRSALKKGDKGRSHYAMNPNCEPNSPKDVVLLFETKGGWNQYGGPEILTFENHKGKGCNILFNSGHVKFVKPEQVGKLKWKAEPF